MKSTVLFSIAFCRANDGGCCKGNRSKNEQNEELDWGMLVSSGFISTLAILLYSLPPLEDRGLVGIVLVSTKTYAFLIYILTCFGFVILIQPLLQ